MSVGSCAFAYSLGWQQGEDAGNQATLQRLEDISSSIRMNGPDGARDEAAAEVADDTAHDDAGTADDAKTSREPAPSRRGAAPRSQRANAAVSGARAEADLGSD